MADPKQPVSWSRARSTEEWLHHIVSECRGANFWGEVTIAFERGIITRVHRNQSLMPPGRAEEPGGSSALNSS